MSIMSYYSSNVLMLLFSAFTFLQFKGFRVDLAFVCCRLSCGHTFIFPKASSCRFVEEKLSKCVW